MHLEHEAFRGIKLLPIIGIKIPGPIVSVLVVKPIERPQLAFDTMKVNALLFLLIISDLIFGLSLPNKFVMDSKLLGSSESVLIFADEPSLDSVTRQNEVFLSHTNVNDTSDMLQWFDSLDKSFTIIIYDRILEAVEDIFNSAPSNLRRASVWFLPDHVQVEKLVELRLDSKVFIYSLKENYEASKISSIYRIKNGRPTRMVETGLWTSKRGFTFQINSHKWWRERSNMIGTTLTFSALHWPPMVLIKQ